MSEREYERYRDFLIGSIEFYEKQLFYINKNFMHRIFYSKEIYTFKFLIDHLKFCLFQYKLIHTTEIMHVTIKNISEDLDKKLEKSLEWCRNNPPIDNFEELIKEMEGKIKDE
jgi:hypothetical protein